MTFYKNISYRLDLSKYMTTMAIAKFPCVSCVIYVLFLSCFRVSSLLPCGHLKGKADLLALVCEVYCDFVTFPFGIHGQVWYLIIMIPDPCCLSNFKDLLWNQLSELKTQTNKTEGKLDLSIFLNRHRVFKYPKKFIWMYVYFSHTRLGKLLFLPM